MIGRDESNVMNGDLNVNDAKEGGLTVMDMPRLSREKAKLSAKDLIKSQEQGALIVSESSRRSSLTRRQGTDALQDSACQMRRSETNMWLVCQSRQRV